MVRAEEINMENREDILDALCMYEKKPTPDIPPLLESFLRQIAKTGETMFPWQRLKLLMINKLDQVITQFHQDFPSDPSQTCPNVENARFDEMRKRILRSVEEFQGAPFTIQRICELMTEPKKHYKRSDKFLRGIEKNVLVVSTVDPFGRKIVSEARLQASMVNGMDLNGYNNEQLDQRPSQFSGFPSAHQSEGAECPRVHELQGNISNNNNNNNNNITTEHETLPQEGEVKQETPELNSQTEVKADSPSSASAESESNVKNQESVTEDSQPEDTNEVTCDAVNPTQEEEGQVTENTTREECSPEKPSTSEEEELGSKDQSTEESDAVPDSTDKQEESETQDNTSVATDRLSPDPESSTHHEESSCQQSFQESFAPSSSDNPTPDSTEETCKSDTPTGEQVVHESTENSVESPVIDSPVLDKSNLPNDTPSEIQKTTDASSEGENMEVDSSNIVSQQTSDQGNENSQTPQLTESDNVTTESESKSSDVPMEED